MLRSPKRALAALFAAASLATIAVPAATAQPNPNNQSGGVAGLVAALVNVNVQDVLNNVLNGSLNGNNVQLVNVPVNLTNVLNNNAILSNNTVVIQDFLNNFLNNPNCSVVALCNSLDNILNNNNVAIGQVVGLNVLSGGLVVYVLPPA
jgi:hypothetical protein